ncbi:DUF4145 domain-containing protein [Sutterella wadsworthensis]|uniref:DUF4145 domain-containing protein n=1 Tax=Sutterella wadsworthensis TaxID=40545 RepID=UPI003AF117E5
MVFPEMPGMSPNADMTPEAKKTFLEAQSILGKSPRGACMLLRLCLEQLLTELDFKDDRLADKIKKAASDGTPVKALMDACRLAGNEFVHAGTLESLDKSKLNPQETAEALSEFINQVVFYLVTTPAKIKEIDTKFSTKR